MKRKESKKMTSNEIEKAIELLKEVNPNELKKTITLLEETLKDLKDKLGQPEIKMSFFKDKAGNEIPLYDINNCDVFYRLSKDMNYEEIYAMIATEFNIAEILIEFSDHEAINCMIDWIIYAKNKQEAIEGFFDAIWDDLPQKDRLFFLHEVITSKKLNPLDYV